MFPRLSELTARTTQKAQLTEARREGDLSELIEKYQDQNKMYSFEGSRGKRNFEKLVSVLGYGSLSEFFEDNSGCFEAMVKWIGSQRNQEWIEAFESEVGGSDEDEDGDEDR